MNKLEEYKQMWSHNYFRTIKFPNHQDKEDNFKAGFDAAIALDLPVEFHEWCVKSDTQYKEFVRAHYGKKGEKDLAKELYQYWIENIFKINP